jgi:hypothetical protein
MTLGLEDAFRRARCSGEHMSLNPHSSAFAGSSGTTPALLSRVRLDTRETQKVHAFCERIFFVYTYIGKRILRIR